MPGTLGLGRVLDRMDAMARAGRDPVPAVLDGRFLSTISTILNLVTAHGDVDLVLESAGNVGDFDRWLAHASDEEVAEGVRVFVASLDDVIAAKRAANRLKDQRDLPYLEALRDEIG